MKILYRINWSRGLNRIFVVLCVAWTVFVAWYQLNHERNVISNNYAQALQTAYDNEVTGQHLFAYLAQKQQAETDFQNAWKETGLLQILEQIFLTRTGIMIAVLPPLFLYGIIWGRGWSCVG